jgi:hypothetical protein
MRDNAVSTRTVELTRAVDSLHATLRERLPKPEPVITLPPLHKLSGLRIALAFCHDAANGECLAERFVKVPESHVYGPQGLIRCPCGAETPVSDLSPCTGSCGRWFAGTVEDGVWAARL